ncbi:MAG: MFS transporter [Gammaproteobacteria bacterium]|nr:MAG: MFS transporter [Gammaproteobacteria bacterium]
MNRSGQPIFHGWWNVLVAFNGMALSYAMFTVFTFGTFVRPLEQEFGWARGEISFALTMTNFAVVIASPSIGSLLDRFGVRAVLIPSTLLMGLAVASMSLLSGELLHFYAMYLLIPLLGAGTLPQSYSRVIINWFHRRRGIALGLALSGFGVGAALVPVCAQYLIEHIGWRFAYLAFGAAVLGISLPLALFLMRESPREMGLEPDGVPSAGQGEAPDPPQPDSGLSIREAAGTTSFWLIFGSFLLVGVAITGILAHLVPMLIGRGVAPEVAARCMSLLGIGLICGRVISGYLMDRYFAPYVTAFFLTFLFGGAVILALGLGGAAPFLAALMVGLATGSEISEIAYLCSRYFGPRAFCLIYGTMFAAFQIGSAFGPPLMGYYYDGAGNYTGALWGLAGLAVTGAVLIAVLGPYPAGFGVPAREE